MKMSHALAALLLAPGLLWAQHRNRTENAALLGVVTIQEKSRVVIAHVLEESPAAKAGLKVGDVLLQIGEKKIAAPTDVDDALRDATADQKVEVIYGRKRRKGRTEAKLISRKDYQGEFLKRRARGSTGFEAPEWWGYAWENVSRQQPAPDLKNTRGKVVVFHTFQSW